MLLCRPHNTAAPRWIQPCVTQRVFYACNMMHLHKPRSFKTTTPRISPRYGSAIQAPAKPGWYWCRLSRWHTDVDIVQILLTYRRHPFLTLLYVLAYVPMVVVFGPLCQYRRLSTIPWICRGTVFVPTSALPSSKQKPTLGKTSVLFGVVYLTMQFFLFWIKYVLLWHQQKPLYIL